MWKDLEWLDPNWHKEHMKKIWKRSLKSNFQKPLLHWIWLSFVNLIDSIQIPDHNPNHERHKAAQKRPLQTWIFSLKSQHWKPLLRAIQRIIFIPIASSRITDHIPIRNHHQNSKNWYIELELHQGKFIIVYHIPCIICEIYSLIHVHYDVLKLTMMFNWIIMLYTRFRHVRFLGFTGLEIRAFAKRKN